MSVYLLSGRRTPMGGFLGGLSTVSAPLLGAQAIRGAVSTAGVDGIAVQEVFMGNVIQAGVGQAPARQAALFSELPESVACTTINKVCGSGLEAIIQGARSIQCGDSDLVVSGGMENMSMAPGLLPSFRSGHKFGPTEMKDSMQWDGLWDVYSNRPMGNCAEECAQKYQFSREEQDAFARSSFERAQQAQKNGDFAREITNVEVPSRKGAVTVSEDEGPTKVNFDKMTSLRPAFEKDGTITAANASSINDGAAALVLGSEKYRDQAKFRIVAYHRHAHNPTWFTTAPVMAMQNCLDKAGLKVGDIDLFEINEAFSLVTMAAMKDLGIDHAKTNIYGGAVSLGHPIGCSGARIVVTLMNAMEATQKQRGMAGICIGGGEALALIIERV